MLTVPASADFAGVLAGHLIEAAGGDPLALARALVLLPNRRAAAALTTAFVARAGRGLLLPRMIAVADLDDADAPLGEAEDETTPPAVDPEARRFWLAARLVALGARPAPALRDAAGLARALDTLILAERRPADLDDIETGRLSDFWARTLLRLRLIAQAWPAELAHQGRIDAAARRVALVRASAAAWRAGRAGERLIIAAGILSAPPSVCALLHVVARLPRGLVVLPGLDLKMAAGVWDVLDALDPVVGAHPQAALKAMLDALGVARAEVGVLGVEGPSARRVEMAARALDPAGIAPACDPAALERLHLIETANPGAEALAVAAAMRRALATPQRTAALVTPDRALARRVVAALGRWGISVDDSAGAPLGETPAGAFVRLMAEAAAHGFAAVPALALLQHPLAGAGGDRLAWLHGVRALDLEARGFLNGASLLDVGRRLEAPLAGWWTEVAAMLAPLAPTQALPLGQWAARWSAAAEALTGGQLWRGAAGRALEGLFTRLAEHGDSLPPVGAEAAAAALAVLLSEAVVREPFGAHPRLSIWGLLEARLQRADLLILGGLNEGVWPAPAAPDPWLPPVARKALGLPPLEARVGLSAHDFVQALGAHEVLLTRARRDASAPTSPSRLLLRLQAAAAPAGLPRDAELEAVVAALDQPHSVTRAARPRPAPPPAARPRRINVTDVDLLLTDPFAFYARRVLRLRELDPIDCDLPATERGEFLHTLLDRWAKGGADPAALPGELEARFARRYGRNPRLRALWLPRLRNAAEWAADLLAEGRAAGTALIATERGGEAEVGGVTLVGRADRVDMGPGGLAIIDYKSGSPPTNRQICAGYALQLPLTAALAGRGALQDVPAGPVAALAYWSLPGRAKEPGTVKAVEAVKDAPWADAEAAIAYAVARLAEAAADYLAGSAPFTAKLKPEFAAVSRTYDQLGRLDEWLGRA